MLDFAHAQFYPPLLSTAKLTMSGSSFELETDSVGPSETSTLPGDSDTSSSAP